MTLFKRCWPVGLLFCCVLSLSACIDLGRNWDDQTETLYVDYYKEQCDEDSTELCFRIRESSSDSWEVVEVPFSGFDEFEWGLRYTVSVTTSFDDDGDPSSYSLRSVTAADELVQSEKSFALTLYSDTGILYALDQATWELGSEFDFACNDACDDLSNAVANHYVSQLEFDVDDDGVVSLGAVICAAGEDDFSSECEGETNQSWRIAWYQSDCGLAYASMCLLYKVNSSDDFELLQLEDDIDGFTPVWGSRYDIDVVKTVSNAGNITYVELDEDDSDPDDRTSSSYKFKFIVRGDVLSDSASGYIGMYDDAPDLDCGSYSLCSRLNDYTDDDQWLLLQGYVDGDIVVSSIICHDEDIDEFRECVADEEDVNWPI